MLSQLVTWQRDIAPPSSPQPPGGSHRRSSAIVVTCAVLLASMGCSGESAATVPDARTADATVADATAGTAYDLTAEWSASVNPNGPWTYSEGAAAIPLTQNWNGGNSTWSISCAQPAWAPSNVAGRFLPAWLQVASCAAPYFPADPNNLPANNVLAGNVVVHTNDNSNGDLSLGSANVVFVLPASGGMYRIAGALWAARLNRFGSRSQDWAVTLNGSMIAMGQVTSTVSRSTPQTFSVTQQLIVGDRVQLTIAKDAAAGAGDFIGVQISLTPVE